MSPIGRILARAQVGLAFFYGIVFVGMFLIIAIFWDRLSKLDVGILTMFATGAMNQSKDASSYFFARHRSDALPDDDPKTTPIRPVTPAPSTEILK
jgi:hypothetical protein